MATTDTWIGTASADWGASAANWSSGFPTSNSKVVINTANILTIGFGGGDTDIVNSLTVGNDFFDMTGGSSLTILGTASFAKGFTQTGGTLTVGGAVTINGAGTMTGGAAEGNGAFTIGGTIALANYTLGGSVVLNNAKTTNETGQITLGDNTGVGTTINNKTGAVFNIAGDYGIGQGAATASFVNAGTLEKTGGVNTSFVDVSFADTGAVTIASGTLEFRGPNDSFVGSISGAGGFALGGGGHDTIAGAATLAAASFVITDSGTLVTLGKSLSFAGNFTVSNFATLNLGKFTLTVSGSDTFANSLIEGSGTLATKSGSDAGVNAFTLGGTVDWQNSGTIGEANFFVIGDGSAHAATFTNEKGGVYNLTNDAGILRGAAANSRFLNLAGATLEKTGGSGTSTVSVDVTDTGAVMVAGGDLEFAGPTNTVAGTVSGSGEFVLGGGSSNTVFGGAAISAATFIITDANTLVALHQNLSYARNFFLQNGAALDIGAGTLTLSGTDTFASSATLDGSGVLVTRSGGSTGVNSFTLGGSVDWQNFGTVGEVATLTLGDTSFNTATFTNEKGSVYNFTTDSGIAIGAALDSSFADLAGATLAKTGGNGISIVSVDMVDTGTIKINTGTIEFEGLDNSFAGAISGGGQFAVGHGSNDVIASGTTITAKTFGIFDGGTVVTLGENLSYTGTFNLENSSVLDLGRFTLTLSGADALANAAAVEGTGVLATAHGGTASVTNFTLGGAASWRNSGTVVEFAALTIGDGSFDAATFTNQKGGVYNFVNDSGIGIGAMPNSSFVNLAGAILEKTGGNGDSAIAVRATNNGAVTVATGRMEFQNLVAGTGAFTVDRNSALQFDASVAAGSSVRFASIAGGDLVLADSHQFGSGIHGFGGSNTDELELLDINFSSTKFKLGYSGSTTQGVLTVTDGANTAHLTMFGNYKTANFHASADGLFGTKIVDPPSHPAVLAFGSV